MQTRQLYQVHLASHEVIQIVGYLFRTATAPSRCDGNILIAERILNAANAGRRNITFDTSADLALEEWEYETVNRGMIVMNVAETLR